jgi:hypothetical protein
MAGLTCEHSCRQWPGIYQRQTPGLGFFEGAEREYPMTCYETGRRSLRISVAPSMPSCLAASRFEPWRATASRMT